MRIKRTSTVTLRIVYTPNVPDRPWAVQDSENLSIDRFDSPQAALDAVNSGALDEAIDWAGGETETASG